jgi:hypothetical protein
MLGILYKSLVKSDLKIMAQFERSAFITTLKTKLQIFGLCSLVSKFQREIRSSFFERQIRRLFSAN